MVLSRDFNILSSFFVRNCSFVIANFIKKTWFFHKETYRHKQTKIYNIKSKKWVV
jgi:hypothetical protein